MSECTCHKNYTLDTLVPQVELSQTSVRKLRMLRHSG